MNGESLSCAACGSQNQPGRKFCRSCGAPLELMCPRCGSPNGADDSFCGECGEALRAPSVAGAGRSEDHAPSSVAPPHAPEVRVLPESFGDGRYRVSGFLGEGGRKVVYRATDARLGREVAVAAIKAEGLDDAALARVWQEARAMARLGDHPNVVTVFDVMETGEAPVVVSQYMPGGSLADRLEAAPDNRLPPEQAVAIASDLCRGLAHAHALGIVHRDLKPANIWLAADGHAVLGDFGLALGGGGPRVTVEGTMLGTVAYMPPEQAVGREAEPRSDLYSLGAVLYEIVTGRPPFLGQDTVAVISQHLNTDPVLPTWFNSEIPPGLEALVMDLLAKAPEHRPPSAAAVEARLGALGSIGREAASGPETRRGGGTATAWRFVGREAEMATLRAAVDLAVGGRGSMVMVVGEPGIGKTRTTEQAAAYATLRGMQVLVGRCYEGDASIPYLPFIEAIRAHVAATAADQLRSELGSGGSDVAKLVSEVRERVGELAPAATAEGPDQERRRLLESVSSFLVNACASTPIMLVLDDLHWADRASLLLLRHLARYLQSTRLLVVGTYRDVELDRRHPLSEVLSDLRRDTSFERVLLRGLSVEEVLDFIEAAAEREVEGPMRRLVPLLHRETEGNPFFIREVLLNMVFTGQIVRRDDRWELADEDMGNLGVPEGVREVIGRRLSRLSDAANSALADAAVLGREFEFAVLARMQGVTEDALVDVIEQALLSQLIVERRGAGTPTYAFSHALVRETLYDELSLPRKQRKHLAAGQALEAVHTHDRERILPVLASHFSLAGAAADPSITLDYAQRAAEAALSVFAWEDAIGHMERALEVMEASGGDPGKRAALATRIGDLVFSSTGDLDRGATRLEAALELYRQAGDETRAAQVHSRLGRTLTAYGQDVNRGLPHLSAALDLMTGGGDRPSLVYLQQSLAQAHTRTCDADAGLDAATAAAAMSERLGDERLVASSAAFVGYHLVASGRVEEGMRLLESARADNDRLGQAYPRWSASVLAAPWLWLLGDQLGGEDVLGGELARLEHGGSALMRGVASGFLARCLASRGRLEEAEEAVPSEATILDHLFRQESSLPGVVARGRWEEAAGAAQRLEERAQRRGNNLLAVIAALYAAGALALLGRAVEVVARLRGWLGHVPTLDLLLWSRLVPAAVDAGDLDAARGWLADIEASPVIGENLRGAGAYVARARAAVTAAEGHHGRAIELLTEAVDCSRRYGDTLEMADSIRRRAHSLVASGRVEAALADLSACLDVYEKAGCGPAFCDPIVAERLDLQGVPAVDTGASIAVVAASVAADRPDMAAHAAADGTVTLMFTDLGDSTSLNEKLGDRAWFSVLSAHHDMVRSVVGSHGGSTVKSQGDGFMLAFPSARRAVECAIAIQRAAPAQSAGDEPLRVRIGIHTGEVLRQGEDFFGRHVNLAARVASAAQPGQILVSSLVQGIVSGDHQLHFEDPRPIEMKGFDQPELVYEVVWS